MIAALPQVASLPVNTLVTRPTRGQIAGQEERGVGGILGSTRATAESTSDSHPATESP